MQLLMPLMADMGGCCNTMDGEGDESSRETLPTLSISILTDNARPLRREDSMTMRSLQKEASVKMCRWSSSPNLTEKSLVASSSSVSGTPRRSNDDLINLMLKNSRIPRSTDDLRKRSSNLSASTGHSSLMRWSDGAHDPAPQPGRNGHWEIRKKTVSKRENPFDLRMADLPINSTNVTINVVPAVQPAFLVPPEMKVKSSPKIPERQASSESKREDNMVDPKSAMHMLLKNVKESEERHNVTYKP
jgi:hypothetical protein